MKFRIVPFENRHAEAFFLINAEWICKFFSLEAEDERVLRNPQAAILDPGGVILMAEQEDSGEAIGAVSLLYRAPGVFELSKMSVSPSAQGQGAGRALVIAAIEAFGKLEGRELFLETHSSLAPAIRLYESLGFEKQAGPRPGSPYARADVYMIWRRQSI